MKRSTKKWLGAALILLSGCANDQDRSTEYENGVLTICYRGERVVASLVGDDYIIEDDILVHESDIWCDTASTDTGSSGVSSKSQATRRQGASYRWPGGVVPYEFGSDSDATDQNGDGVIDSSDRAADFTPAREATIVAAMTEWQDRVPGLSFRPVQSGDTNRLRFEPDLHRCNSSTGKVGTTWQRVNLTVGCLGGKATHHEIAHALGLFHHHTRKDRDSFVTINWANIQGCPSTATSSSDCGEAACAGNLADCGCTAADVANTTCYRFGNFATNSSRADILAYDYGSLMHYGATDFTKGGTTIVTPNGQAIGQRTALSELDTASMRALYPDLQVHRSVFVTVGVPVKLCTLSGRDEDAATKFRHVAPGSTGSFTFGGNFQTFILDVKVTSYDRECGASSNFWARNYNYPNSDSSLYGTGDDELFVREGEVTLMTSGLIPVLL